MTLTLVCTAPGVRVDLSALCPALAAGANLAELAHLPVAGAGGTAMKVGDAFALRGSSGGDVVIEGSHGSVDGIGAGLMSGRLIVEGDVGDRAGAGMRGGALTVRGSAGAYMASGMRGGVVHVTRKAGDFVGGVGTGKRFGMTGGCVIVEGDIGARAGDKMRRGLVLARGRIGAAAGSRMIGGTIIAERGFGPHAGQAMRRGTLIGPSVDAMSATFADCGWHDLVILAVMARAWKRELGDLAPRPLPSKVHRFAGDLAGIGRGEVLLTG